MKTRPAARCRRDTLNVLRSGFKKTPARFAMCQFRQVRYSQKIANSIDLVLFAVSDDEVAMTTRLAGRATQFLPDIGGKDTTYVLDFVNDPGEVLGSFKPYYREASLEDTTDPDIVHDLQAKLDAADIYTTGEVEAFTTAYLVDQRHGAIDAPLKTAAGRFNSGYAAAVAAGDKAEVEELDLAPGRGRARARQAGLREPAGTA